MLRLIKQVFSASSSSSRSLAIKLVSLKSKTCLTRPTRINLDPFEFNYYPFIVNPDKCKESCNDIDDLSTNMCVLSETKDVKC